MPLFRMNCGLLFTKRTLFGLFLGFLLAGAVYTAPKTDMEAAQALLSQMNGTTVTKWFQSDKIETTPSDDFKALFNNQYPNTTLKKRFVLLIPGIGTSHLELWKAKPCFQKYVRSQLWGSPSMIFAIMANKQCWLEHMRLQDGLDPDGVKVRPLKDLLSAEYFMGNYWVWAKIVENLLALDYDINDIQAAVYDWRLATLDLETRDGYFQDLKSLIESKVRFTHKKITVLTHSMGGLVYFAFMKWVESPLGGQGGDGWISDHIHSIVNIGVPFLGCPKAIAGILSGEMKDTAELGPYGNSILDVMFNRMDRRDLFWTLYGAFSMIPKGGNRIWGSEYYNPDDPDTRQYQQCHYMWEFQCPKSTSTFYFVNYHYHSGALVSIIEGNIHLSLDSLYDLLGDYTNKEKEWCHVREQYNSAFYTQSEMGQETPAMWTNPLASPLPKTYNYAKTHTGKYLDKEELLIQPTIYCMYGYDKPTERKYFYRNFEQLEDSTDPQIDTTFHHVNNVTYGVHLNDGDGTVNLLSLSAMCVDGWTHAKYNPSHIPVITKEFRDLPTDTLRGGPKSADHIDILGNEELIGDILKIATIPNMPVDSRVRESTIKKAQSLFLNE